MASVPKYLLPGITVTQPPHLEGDPALATEILPGPPSLISAQQSSHRHDPRKPATVVSYLPTTDPGSTYSMHTAGTLGSQDSNGPRRKRARIDRGTRATGRAQRASARNVNGSVVASVMTGFNDAQASSFPVDSDPLIITLDSDEHSLSRSNSVPNLQEGTSVAANGRTRSGQKDKGKRRETETAVVCVKEEPNTISLHSPEPPPINLATIPPHISGNRILTSSAGQLNEDHCSACHSQGALVYCDGCPRAFHFWCLDPPMEATDLPEGDSWWFCPSCTIRKDPPPKPPPSILSPLIHHAQTNIPTEYQLPEDIRTFFKDVATGPRGAYVDAAEIKQPRLNRHGQLEDRDPHRLKDRNGVPVLCFRCGMSALPGGLAATKQPEKQCRRPSPSAVVQRMWRSIVSCDHCPLHWHLDCLDPPLSNMPSFGKKWMCPNHADQLLHPKRRIPKYNATPVVITKSKQFNNGNIEITHAQAAHATENNIAVDEILINGRRYRVPERVVILDFWDKVGKAQHSSISDREADALSSGISSPLTSLSSLEDPEESSTLHLGPPSLNIDDIKVAEVLCTLKHSTQTPKASASNRELVDKSAQTDGEVSEERNLVKKRVIKRVNMRKDAESVVEDGSASSSLLSSSSALGRRKSSAGAQLDATRELRSSSKSNVAPKSPVKLRDGLNEDISITNGSAPHPRLPSSTVKVKHSPSIIKVETREIQCITLNGLNVSDASKPTSSSHKRAQSTRRPAKSTEGTGRDTETRVRGEKRKERDESEAMGSVEKERRGEPSAVSIDERWEQERKEKASNLPYFVVPNLTPVPRTSTSTHLPPPPSTTPSLKIRLPRLTPNFGSVRTPSLSLDSSKRA